MNEKQALDIVSQGINVALGNGAFKNTRDVAILSQALEVLANHFMAVESADMAKDATPVEKKKSK